MTATTGTVVDARDGKTYKTILMPDGKWWTAENLAWAGSGVDYDNDPANRAIYGRLYTWTEATTLAAFPGTHLPSETERDDFVTSVGGVSSASKLMSTGSEWLAGGVARTNDFGFSALPAGFRNTSGTFNFLRQTTYFWTSTSDFGSAFYFSVTYNNADIQLSAGLKGNSFSVRLIVDSGNIPDATLPVTYSPPAGTYGTPQTVALSTETAGASIYYTMDGSEPTSGSTLYTAPLTISETTTVKAIAVKVGLGDSAASSAEYVIGLSFLGAPISGLERGYSVSIDRHVAVREAIGGGVRLIPRAPAQSDVWTVDAEVMLTAAQAGPFEAAVGAYGSDSTGILNLPARGGASTFAGLAPAVAGAGADTYIITAMRNPDAMGRRAVAVDLFAYRVQFDLIGSANAPIALTSTIPDWLPKKFATHSLRDSSQWNVYASPSTGFPIHPAAKVKHGRGQGHTIALDALDDSQVDHLVAWYRNSRSAPVTITIDRGIAGQGAVSVYLVDLSLARDVGLHWSGSLEVVEA